MYEINIVEKTKDGIRNAASDAKYFTENFSALINAEYLITTNIAKSISELGPMLGSEPISTHLEESTVRFASRCVPLMKKPLVTNVGSGKYTFRKPKNASRNGRIDIGVYKQDSVSPKPICAIEVKSINPTKSLVIKDLKRNVDFFQLYCNTGKSVIEFTEFCAIHTFKALYNSEKQSHYLAVKSKYDTYMKSVKLPINVEYEVIPFTAHSVLLDESDSQEEFDQTSDDLHHYVGVIVVFRWKKS